MARPVAVFAVLSLAITTWSTAHAQQSQRQPPPQQPPPQQQPPQPPSPAGAAAPGADLVSIDRVRKDLERPPALAVTPPDPKVPVYRVHIEGYSFHLPTLQEKGIVPPSPVPQPIGGGDYYEMMRLITPPAAWGSASMSNGDVLKLLETEVESWALFNLPKKAYEAYKNAAPARARAEVLQELADIAAHNARVAAGQGDAAEKKKQEEAKKK